MLGACLFLPYYGWYFDSFYVFLTPLLLLIGGPVPFLSSAAFAMVAILMRTNPRGAVGPAIAWLALSVVAFVFTWSARDGVFEDSAYWSWVATHVFGLWVLLIALRAPPRTRRQHTSPP